MDHIHHGLGLLFLPRVWMHVYSPSSNRFKHLSHMIIASRKRSCFSLAVLFTPNCLRVRDLRQNDAIEERDTYLSSADLFLCVSAGGTHSISILSQTPSLSRSCPLFSIPGWSLLSESTFMMLTSWRWWIQLCHTSVTFLQTVGDFIWSGLLMWSLSGLFFLRKHELCRKDFSVYTTPFWIWIPSRRH